MAKTIQQIQDLITSGLDIRQIINELADYIQANPGGGGGGGGVDTVTGNLVDNTDPDNPIVDLPAVLPAVDGSQLTNLPAPSLGYLVYVAKITQESTDPPIATIYQNTLGGVPILTRDGAGLTIITTDGLFNDKVIAFATMHRDIGCALFAFSKAVGDDNVITMLSYAGGVLSDDYDVSVEIRVYPE